MGNKWIDILGAIGYEKEEYDELMDTLHNEFLEKENQVNAQVAKKSNFAFEKKKNKISVERDAADGYWTTKEGKCYHITQMDNLHLENTIYMLARKDLEHWMPWITVMMEELAKRKAHNYTLTKQGN